MNEDKPYITCSRIDCGELIELARHHRKNPTEAEAAMWQMLRDKFYGVKFRRQHIIDHYIADFVCLSHRLVIEIDGGYHTTDEQRALDAERTDYLSKRGLTVIRFTNEEVLSDTDNVLNKIKHYLKTELFL